MDEVRIEDLLLGVEIIFMSRGNPFEGRFFERHRAWLFSNPGENPRLPTERYNEIIRRAAGIFSKNKKKV